MKAILWSNQQSYFKFNLRYFQLIIRIKISIQKILNKMFLIFKK